MTDLVHPDPHPLAGKTVSLGEAWEDGAPSTQFVVEDWWDRVSGGITWGHADGHPDAMSYGMRAGFNGLPWDDEVVYGTVYGAPRILHNTELGEVVQ